MSLVSQGVENVHQYHNATNVYQDICHTWTSATHATSNAQTACMPPICACHASQDSTKCSHLVNVCLVHIIVSNARQPIIVLRVLQHITFLIIGVWYVRLLIVLIVRLWGPVPISVRFV